MGVEKILAAIIGGIFQGIATAATVKVQIPAMTKIDFRKLSLCLSIYGTISLLFIDNQFRFIATVMFITFLIYFILKVRRKIIVLYAFDSVMILAFAEIIVSLALVLYGINSKEIVNNYHYNTIANILISLLALFIIQLNIFKKSISKGLRVFKNKSMLINY